MKYRVYVKEIWVQPYIVEANSKAHAKALLQGQRAAPGKITKDRGRPQKWGMVGPETWDVEELG